MKPDYDAIAARLAAATPGEWEKAAASSYLNGKPKLDEWFVRRVEDDVSIAADVIDPDTSQPSEANAAFIAAAPTDIRALLTRARALEAVADAATEVYNKGVFDDRIRRLGTALSQLQRLDASPVVEVAP